MRAGWLRWLVASAVSLSADGREVRVSDLPHRDALLAACDTEVWQAFLAKTSVYCLNRAPWACMHHPFFVDEAWDALAASVPWAGSFCLSGVGAASVIFMRDMEHRGDSILTVDVVEDEDSEEAVVLSFRDKHSVRLPLDYPFAPFPYTARDLVPFRARNVNSMRQLALRVANKLTAADIIWLPWLGFLRFWAEAGSEVYQVRAAETSLDIVVPIEAEERLLSLRDSLADDGGQKPTRRLYMFEVHPHRLVQLSLNGLPELGDAMDLRHVCPSCVVLSVYFLKPDGKLTTERPPCSVTQQEVHSLEQFRDQSWDPGAGLVSRPALDMLREHGPGYFFGEDARPCNLDLSDLETVPDTVALGDMSRTLAASNFQVDDSGRFVLQDLEWTSWLHHPEEGAGSDEMVSPWVMSVTDFSKEVEGLEGAPGWFSFMEARMTAKRSALAIFQTKMYMKKLMAERGIPIPRLIHLSLTSPDLPFGPPLPLMQGGYVVKPAHLAESSHVFVISEDGTDLLTGTQPTWQEVQDNISMAWGRSLSDYDQAGASSEDQQCARSKRYGQYLQNRSCANWALYSSPPGLIIEELVRPSRSYDALQVSAFAHQGLDVKWRQQPDEIKCHVVWGKVFVAEWVSSKAFLGFIFRHGHVKDNIVVGPKTLELCWEGGLPLGQVCEFMQTWEFVRGIAEKAVPPGVDYMRVDIFPNHEEPVVNELSVAGYSTLLEEWMLVEMMRRVREGYRWRGLSSDRAPRGTLSSE